MNIDMDGEGGNTEEAVETWAIYRDPFTTTSLSHASTKPKPKPWERAPVPAHAPRLAGQKIWKKANSLHTAASQHTQNQDKENAVQVELELEKGGVGARKRIRGARGKENIGEAKFMSSNAEMMEMALDGHGVESSPKKIMVMRDEDAFVVPRKRTNSNHLITPRKALRHLDNNVAAPAMQAYEQQTIKSPAKSTKIPLNDCEGAEQEEKEKQRRRKSMRRSRRLTESDMVEDSVEDRKGAFVFGQKSANGDVEMFSGFELPAEQINTLVEETSADTEDSGAFQELFSDATLPVVENRKLAAQNQSAAPTCEAVETSPIEEPLSVQQTVESELEISSKAEDSPIRLNESLEDHLEAIVATLEDQPVQAAIETINIQSTELAGLETSAVPPQTPLKSLQLAATSPQSVQPDLGIVPSPSKSMATPRSRRKTPQRSASRRSNRITRHNSTPLVEHSAEDVQDLDDPTLKTANEVSRSVGPQFHLVDSIAVVNSVVTSHGVGQLRAHEKDVADITAAPLVSRGEDPKANITVHALQKTNTMKDAHKPGAEEVNISIAKAIDEISVTVGQEILSEVMEGSSEQESPEEQLRQEFETSTLRISVPPAEFRSFDSDLVQEVSSEEISEESAESFEPIEPISILMSNSAPCSPTDEASEELQESSTPDPTTSELTEAISENAPSTTVYDHDDTDMLRDFLSKVKANKAAKATTSIPKRKRSLPHSPLQIPLGTVDTTSSPSSPKEQDDYDVGLPTASPSKRRKRNGSSSQEHQEDEIIEPRSIRRSVRTRLPVKAAPVTPSFIPVRRIGQDGDGTVTLPRNEEKELAALTRINTRKNKAGASNPLDILAKESGEKDDAASRQRALKEVFEEENYTVKLNKRGRSVVWAEDLAHFQTEEGKKVVSAEKGSEREKKKPILPSDKKKSASTPNANIGMQNKKTLGIAGNGTPAPKRRVRGRS